MPASRTTPPGTWWRTSSSCATHLGIERWQVFGGSWGSTLALAYAQRHPERVTELVLRGIFLLRRSELEWFYQSRRRGRAVPGPVGALRRAHSRGRALRHDGRVLPAAHQQRSPPSAMRRRAPGRSGRARPATCAWIRAMWPSSRMREYAAAFARIECHYFVNRGFLDADDQLLRDVLEDPPHPGDHRAGPLRRGVPDAQRLGICTAPGPRPSSWWCRMRAIRPSSPASRARCARPRTDIRARRGANDAGRRSAGPFAGERAGTDRQAAAPRCAALALHPPCELPNCSRAVLPPAPARPVGSSGTG